MTSRHQRPLNSIKEVAGDEKNPSRWSLGEQILMGLAAACIVAVLWSFPAQGFAKLQHPLHFHPPHIGGLIARLRSVFSWLASS